MTLQGKKAIVTGGSRGIGAAIARRLAADGADVAITFAGNREAADAIVAEITSGGRQGFAIQADASDRARQSAAIGEAAGWLGGLDILVHNAGVASFVPLAEEDDANYDRTFGVNVGGVNVGGVHAGTRAALPHLADGGRVIIVGSISGDKALFPGVSTYSATKAAVQALARGWALDLAPRGILVNVIQPGPIDTDLNPADGPLAGQMLPLIPLGRYGRPGRGRERRRVPIERRSIVHYRHIDRRRRGRRPVATWALGSGRRCLGRERAAPNGRIA